MTYIQELKRTNESEPHSFIITFHLGMDVSGKPIIRTSILIAPPELCEEEFVLTLN